MKRATVFLGEMTNPEVEEFLTRHNAVIVPTGATEQHGPHAPLATDVLIPQEIARRVAPKIGAVVAPPLSYALSYPHVGFKGLVHIRIPTFMALVEDVAVAFATAGFRRIIFLNGHYDNTYAIAYACANAADRLPRDAKAFPLNYWDGFPADVAREYISLAKGMHANAAETGAILAIDPGLVDMDKANTSPRSRTTRSTPDPYTPRSSSRLPARWIGPRSPAPGATPRRRRRSSESAISRRVWMRRSPYWPIWKRRSPRCRHGRGPRLAHLGCPSAASLKL